MLAESHHGGISTLMMPSSDRNLASARWGKSIPSATAATRSSRAVRSSAGALKVAAFLELSEGRVEQIPG
jgi:hypothetical protein